MTRPTGACRLVHDDGRRPRPSNESWRLGGVARSFARGRAAEGGSGSVRDRAYSNRGSVITPRIAEAANVAGLQR